MRVLCLVDFQVGASKWLWDWLPAHNDQVEFICASPNRRLIRYSKLLAYAFAYGWQAIQAIVRVYKCKYDVVVAWESKNGFLFGVLRRLLRRQNPRFVILAFGLRGPLLRLLPLTRYLMRTVDAITVPSSGEKNLYTERLALLPDRLHVCPNGMYDLGTILVGPNKARLRDEEEYIFAGGYSHRDFGTLLAATREMSIHVRIIAPRRRPFTARLPKNVEWYEPLPSSVYYRLMCDAGIVVIPLKNVPFAVGLVELLNAMALGKAIVITRTIATIDYVESGRNGILVEPGDHLALRQAIEYLLQNPVERERIANEARAMFRARYTFDIFARRVHQIISEISTNEPSRGS